MPRPPRCRRKPSRSRWPARRDPKAVSTPAAAGRAAQAPRQQPPPALQRDACHAASTAALTRAPPRRLLRISAQDVIAQAVTGSGKTAAYLLPALHRLLTQPAEAAPPPRALVLVPTRELCAQVRPPPPCALLSRSHPHARALRAQVRDEAAALASAAGGTLRIGQLPPAGAPAAALAAAAGAPPDLLVATPARVAQALREGLFRPGAITRGLQLLGASRPRQRLPEAATSPSGGCARVSKPLTRLCPCAAQCLTRRTCCCRSATKTTLAPSRPSCRADANACSCQPPRGAPRPRCRRSRAPVIRRGYACRVGLRSAHSRRAPPCIHIRRRAARDS